MKKYKKQKNKVVSYFKDFQLSTFYLPSRRRGGFTIIELIVTVAIFIIIYTIVLVKQSEFNSSIRLTNLAYEIALQIREAQTFGLSVREFGVGSGRFDLGYGVYLTSSTLDSFIFFADDDRDWDYDSGNEFLDQLSIQGGNTISKFCVTSDGNEDCSNDTIDKLVIVFERPNPDAKIITDIGNNYDSARIEIISPNGSTRTINIESTGRISISK